MSNIQVETFKKMTLTNQNITLTYDGQEDEVTIKVDRVFGNGVIYKTDYFGLHPSYIDPLVNMLNELKDKLND